MHETALMQNLMTAAVRVLEGRNVTRVNRVTVSIGRFANVLPDAFLFAFEAMTQDGIFKGAKLETEQLSAKIYCSDCGNEYEADGFPIVCPNCQSTNFTIISGEEVYLKSLECEEEQRENGN
jgi:hydrogenase nickel incorporation protein HypA/HybF